MHHNRRPAIAEQRVRPVHKRHLVVLQLDSVGLALSVNCEVPNIPGVVPVWTIEPVLLALRIEMSARRLKIRPLALRNLVEVNAVLPRGQIVQMQFDAHPWPLLPERSRAHTLSLCILEFDLQLSFGLSRAPAWQRNQHQEQSDGQSENDIDKAFHKFQPPGFDLPGSRNYSQSH